MNTSESVYTEHDTTECLLCLVFYSFSLPFLPAPLLNHSLTIVLVSSTTLTSSIVGGYDAGASHSPLEAFSTSSLTVRRRVLPDRVLGNRPQTRPPSVAMEPTSAKEDKSESSRVKERQGAS